jgi:hypothetical protein
MLLPALVVTLAALLLPVAARAQNAHELQREPVRPGDFP